MARKPEAVFGAKVMADLSVIPRAWFERIQQNAIRGTPDILGCVNGLFVGLELKADETKHPTELQRWKLMAIETCGGRGWIVRPSNWPEVLREIRLIAERGEQR